MIDPKASEVAYQVERRYTALRQKRADRIARHG